MDLISLLEEQFTFGFTGRINILQKDSKQYLGAIYQKEGQIIHSQYLGDKGKKALFKIIYDSQKLKENLQFVSEPEIIESSIATFSLNNDSFYSELKEFLQDVDNSQSLRPPGHLRLMIDPSFIITGNEVDPNEFDVLLIISDHSKVDEIYKESDQYEYIITKSLVSLRKKKAIKVIT